MGLLDKYKTAETAEQGVEFEIESIDGTPTGDVMVVRGSDSETFIKARAAFYRANSAIEEKDDETRELLVRKNLCDFAAKIVVSVNSEPISDVSIFSDELLTAPAVREQIEKNAIRREKFIKKKSMT
jgi:hypothetical protein